MTRLERSSRDTTSPAWFAVDATERITRVNDAFLDLAQRDADDLLGRPAALTFARTRDQLPAPGPAVLITGDGRLIDIDLAPFEAESQGLERAFEVNQKTYYYSLDPEFPTREAEDVGAPSPYALFYRRTPIPMHVVNGDGRIVDVNESWLQALGYRREEVVGRTLADFLTPRTRDHTLREVIPGYFASGQVHAAPYRFLRRDGSEFDAELSAALVGGDGTMPVRGVSVFVDVTERNQAEAERNETEARLQDFLNTASDWYWETDRLHRFTWLTEPAKGEHRPGRQFPGRTRWEIAGADPTDPAWSRHIATLNAHEPFRDFHFSFVTPSGELVYRRTSGNPIFDETGTFLGYRGTARDVTRQREAEVELHRLNEDLRRKTQQLSQFSYIASHDLKEPLRKVRDFVEILEEDLRDRLDAPQRQVMAVITDATARMSQLIDDLLDLAHADQSTSDRRKIDLSDILHDVIDERADDIEAIGADIEVGPLPAVIGDKPMLRSLFHNLLSNALKYRAPSRRLAIRIKSLNDDGMTRIELTWVRESGPR